jgi:hypothetical protein
LHRLNWKLSKPHIGIDLGTTNCALSLSYEEKAPESFAVTQLAQPGELRARELLPSFLFLAGEKDFAPGATDLPWESNTQRVTGELARVRGAEIPSRLVHSAKSWLSSSGRDAMLPLSAAEGAPRVSPVEASAAYLQHLSAAWQHAGHAPLAEHAVVITVPASFDARARDLTLEAAQQAGLSQVVLLEEPQAAFYAWVARHPDWREYTAPGDRILIVDIGGGTTDFTLIAVRDEQGTVALERIAAGDHILLGGDNMDLALARWLESSRQTKLDAAQVNALWQQCRRAKEHLFAEGNTDAEFPITIAGRGSSLIGGSLRWKLPREEAERLLLDGFFPAVASTERPQRARRMALSEASLPYETDAAVTRHLAAFLHRDGQYLAPTHVLLNGGVFGAGQLRQRFLDVLNSWQTAQGRAAVRVLPGEDLMLAVAHGAAAYGAVRAGKGLRVRGGVPRSYYIGIEESMPAVPGFAPRMKAMTVVPFGMEEGEQHSFPAQRFGLVTGEAAEFRFFSSSRRQEDEAGLMLDPIPEELEELTPMEVNLPADGQPRMERVTLESVVTETGMLQLWCVSASGQRWKLEFNVRERRA